MTRNPEEDVVVCGSGGCLVGGGTGKYQRYHHEGKG